MSADTQTPTVTPDAAFWQDAAECTSELGAEAVRRAEKAESENRRLREALERILGTCQAFGGKAAFSQEIRALAKQGLREAQNGNDTA